MTKAIDDHTWSILSRKQNQLRNQNLQKKLSKHQGFSRKLQIQALLEWFPLYRKCNIKHLSSPLPGPLPLSLSLSLSLLLGLLSQTQ